MTNQGQQWVTPLDAARAYRQRGLDPIPLPPRSKNPMRRGWQHEHIADGDLVRRFHSVANVGIRTGALSAHHVDVDLDTPEAVALAPRFLPLTTMIHGRAGNPDSH